MPDLSLPWGGDLSLSPTGGVELVSGPILTQQRLLRRLMTNPGADPFNPGYGAGLARFVGSPINAAAISALVQSQADLEETVASVQSVTCSQVAMSAYGVTIVYIPASNPSVLVSLTFNVTSAGVSVA